VVLLLATGSRREQDGKILRDLVRDIVVRFIDLIQDAQNSGVIGEHYQAFCITDEASFTRAAIIAQASQLIKQSVDVGHFCSALSEPHQLFGCSVAILSTRESRPRLALATLQFF